MKKGILAIIFMAVAQFGFSQYSLTFCQEVSTEGTPQNATSTLTANKEGSPVKILIKSDKQINTTGVSYKISYIDDTGKETDLSNLPQYIEPGWSFAWKKVTFYDPGTYRVKVYDENGAYMTSANLKITTP